MRLFTIQLFLIFAFSVKGQISNIPGAGNEVIRIKKYADIEGSPYLYNDWKAGTITDNTGKVYSNVLLKYDAYKDVLEINQDGSILQLNTKQYPNFSISFADGSTNKVIKHFFKSGVSQITDYPPTIYFEVLNDGPITVLKKYDIKFIEEVVNSYGTAAATKRFQRGEKYFVVIEDKAVEFKLNNKSFLSACGERMTDIDKIINQRKIKLKNEADLIALLQFYENP
ncbi:MAG TPA: hypothetical protein PLV21_18170 [Cyclobacteriaceae bacterium]|nr:hypothetical protein [Cyclobacteriaceae bacterium]HRJ83818.1 hypothetical protein [Cyclobacteriaceae bacterium]